MAYIGAEPVPGQNREVDDISSGFNGNATAFTLQVSSVNVSPESANNILINLGGVLQNPGTDYTIAASTITFTTAPAAGLSFFGLILGAGINTATVADGTIGTAKVVDNSITADKLAHTSVTAGSYTTADITVDAQGRVTAAANGTIATAEIADGAVNNAKVNASAAIAGTKISPDFGSQNIATTGSATIGSDLIHAGDTDTKIGFGTDTISLTTNNVTRMTFTGNFIDLPDAGTLRLGNSNDLQISHGSGGASNIVHSNTSQPLKISATGAGNIALLTNSNERMRIDSSGNVIIGATSATNIFTVQFSDSSTSVSDQVPQGLRINNTDNTLGRLSGLYFTHGGGGSANNGIFSVSKDTATASTNAGSDLAFYTKNNGQSLMTEKMRIDASGNVGIGTTSPDRTIHCHNSSNTTNVRTKFSNGTTGEGASDGFEIGINASDPAQAVLVNNENSPMAFFTNATEKMHLTSKGGLRTLMDDGDSVVALFKRTAGVNSHNLFEIRYSGSTPISGGTLSFAIETDGDVKNTNNSYGSLSDLKLKENIVDAKSQWDDIKALKVRNYNFKSDTGFQSHTQIGLVAQEVELVSSGLVIDSIDRDDDGKDLGTTTKSLRYSVLHIKALKALQEAMAKIETLETKVAALEAA